MELIPDAFLKVPINTYDKNPCSPADPGANWRGIHILAPRQVLVDREESGADILQGAIPICGYYLLNYSMETDQEPLKLVAVNKINARLYSGYMLEEDPSPEEPDPDDEPTDPALYQGMASGGYFNPNLLTYVKLPRGAAVYEIYVEYKGLRSNSVQLEIVEKQ